MKDLQLVVGLTVRDADTNEEVQLRAELDLPSSLLIELVQKNVIFFNTLINDQPWTFEIKLKRKVKSGSQITGEDLAIQVKIEDPVTFN